MVLGAFGSSYGVLGHKGASRCRGCIGAGRECRYSGARKGIGGIRGPLGALRVVGGVGGHQWVYGYKGCRGVRDALGWQVDWELDHIKPQSRVPALPLVSLGE